jgi:tRNA A-37 threonylcarbamoyl transferase component Bud32
MACRWSSVTAVLLFMLSVLGGNARSAAAASPALERRIAFRVWPRHCDIYLELSRDRYLGNSDAPVQLRLSELGSTFRIRFEKAGFYPTTLTLNSLYFEMNDRYPEPTMPPITLSASSELALGETIFGEHPVAGTGILLTLGWFLVGGARWSRRMRKRLLRADTIETWVQASPASGRVGTVLGQHRLVEMLGRGASAEVYRAVPNETLDERCSVAIKIFDERTMTPEQISRFDREVRILRKLDHRNIVRLIDWDRDAGQPALYVVLELVTGRTLQDLLAERPTTLDEFQQWFSELCDAMSYAHANEVLHRDVKPSNIMLTSAGHLKVMDFGIAFDPSMTRLTSTGETAGTVRYMAPEHLSEGITSAFTDQFSMGVLAYEMLTARHPFEHGRDANLAAYLHRLTLTHPIPLSQWAPQLPPELEALIMRMMATQPQERYSSIDEIRNEFTRVLAHG